MTAAPAPAAETATPAANRWTAAMIRCYAAVAVVGLSAVAAAATAGVGVAAASPGAAPAAAGATAVALDDLMLRPEQVAQIMGAKSMHVVISSSDMVDSSGRVSPAQCVSAWNPGELQSYTGSGYTGVKSEGLSDDTAGEASYVVDQTVVSFPTSAEASRYLDTAASAWSDCAGRPLDYTSSTGEHTTFVIGKPATDAHKTVIVVPQTAKDGSTGCERALTMKTNVVVDVLACAAGDATGRGASLAQTIVANMPYSI